MSLAASEKLVSEPSRQPGWAALRNPDGTSVGSVQLRVLEGGGVEFDKPAILHASFAFFMSELRDEAGLPIHVDEHHEEWCYLFQHEPLLCLLAPRDHGKTWTLVAYLLWRLWRHNRDPQTGAIYEDLHEGRFQAVLFSDTLPQADVIFELLQALVIANGELFASITPTLRRTLVRQAGRWSSRRIRLRNGAEALARGYRTSSRGLHPQLVLLDDVLNDSNTLTQYQRDKVWRYFASVIVPMAPQQIVVLGTAFHQNDLLHRLRPTESRKLRLLMGNRPVQFRWVRYRAANFERRQVLWDWKHSLDDLAARKEFDPLLYAREYDNNPIDDSTSMFPYSLTGRALKEHDTLFKLPWDIDALVKMPRATRIAFIPVFRPAADEFVILGMDLSTSAEAGTDYTVLKVAVYNRVTGQRRLLWTYRKQSLSFDGQVMLLRMACAAFSVTLGVVESNGFQSWLHAETMKHAETANRLTGHLTGQEKADLTEGVPGVRLALEHELWSVPVGDAESMAQAQVWQAEMQAFGWKDGKLQGVGEHDDEVMAWWFLDRAAKLIDDWVFKTLQADPDVVTGEDVGIERMRIGPDI